MSDGIPITSLIDFLVSDGAISFPVKDKIFNVRFQDGYGASLGSQVEDARNVVVTIQEFGRSQYGSNLLSDWNGQTINVNITNSPNAAGSGATEMFGVGVVNVNTSEIDFQYRTADGQYANFNIQGIVNHELVHVLTGLPDGLTHNQIVNVINEQTNGGPSRSNDYYDVISPNPQCFLGDTQIQMWPLLSSLEPRSDGSYNERLVMSQVWTKPISAIKAGDLVLSYDKQGRLQPGPVTRTMINNSTHILDFWGTGVTPGHACYCADGPLKGEHAPLMDILRSDTAMMRDNGTLFRATTNCEVGSVGDKMIHAAACAQKPDGSWTEPKPGKLRFGTQVVLPDGRHMSLIDMAAKEGWKVSHDGYMVGMMEGEDGALEERTFLFPYTFGAELPKPEDYILTRSDVTLEAIYAAGEWEQIGTQMSAPESMVGLNTNHTSTLLQPSKLVPNIPPAFATHPDAPQRSKVKHQ